MVLRSLGLGLGINAGDGSGAGAAISVQQAAKRWSGFDASLRRGALFSSILTGLVGVRGIHGYTDHAVNM